ncbi:MAG: hypothetical protein PHQ40_19890 [Anaerolineaceae bacterium]|nr:hypothetical protein [Anaerolineaceae bacterium]
MHTKFLLRFTNLLFVVALVLLTACSSSGQQKQPADAAPSRTPAVTSTAIPTITPTYYFVQMPSSVQSDSGWKINLSALDLQTALGETKSKNKMFLVGLVEIENLTGKSDCIKSDQFMLQNGLQKIKMEREFLEAGKSAYSRDYPGTVLGQCLDANEKQESVLVFDIPATSEDLSLSFQKQTMRLGKIEAIRNPMPTLTPSATVIVPPTATFTPTLTPNATAIPTIAASKTTAPTPPQNVSDTYETLINVKILDYVKAYLDNNELMQQVTNDTSLVVDSNWKMEMGLSLGILNLRADEIAKLEPSPKYVKLHSILVKLANETHLFTDAYAKGIDNLDVVLIEKAKQYLINMNTLVQEATLEMEKIKNTP